MEQPFEEKLSALLSNPELMSKLSAMAQSLGAQPQQTNQPQQVSQPQQVNQSQQASKPEFPVSGIDPNMLKKLGSMAGSFGVDREQRALLSALGPYLSRDRIHKLENAMRAAKMAALAASVVQQKSSTPSSGR